MPRLLRTAKSNVGADELKNNIIAPSHFNRPSPEELPRSENPHLKKATPPKETSASTHHPKPQTGPDKDALSKRANTPPNEPALKPSGQGKRDIISLLKQSGHEEALLKAQENEKNTKETDQTVLNDQEGGQPQTFPEEKKLPKALKKPTPTKENKKIAKNKKTNQKSLLAK